MIYVATRRVGNHVWARMVEGILPNLQQVAPLTETGREEHSFSGPMMTRWLVPIDDTNTMFIELRHLSETEENPTWWVDREQMMPGQIAADTYEEGQRHPGDYEAQVSQRPIAIHGLDHEGLCRDPGAVTATYCNNTVVRLPAGATEAADKKMMRATGTRLAKSYLKNPPLLERAVDPNMAEMDPGRSLSSSRAQRGRLGRGDQKRDA